MFIKNKDRYVSQIVHNEVVHKVVEGIADVPKDVRDHLVQFPEWSDVVEPVEGKILKALKAKESKDDDKDKGSKGEGKDSSEDENLNGEQNPPEDK